MTIKQLAKTVLEFLNDDSKKLTVMIGEEGDNISLAFGISISTIFDGKYLIVGVYGGGFLRTVDWNDGDYCNSDDEVSINYVAEILDKIFNEWFGFHPYEIFNCYKEE